MPWIHPGLILCFIVALGWFMCLTSREVHMILAISQAQWGYTAIVFRIDKCPCRKAYIQTHKKTLRNYHAYFPCWKFHTDTWAQARNRGSVRPQRAIDINDVLQKSTRYVDECTVYMVQVSCVDDKMILANKIPKVLYGFFGPSHPYHSVVRCSERFPFCTRNRSPKYLVQAQQSYARS